MCDPTKNIIVTQYVIILAQSKTSRNILVDGTRNHAAYSQAVLIYFLKIIDVKGVSAIQTIDWLAFVIDRSYSQVLETHFTSHIIMDALLLGPVLYINHSCEILQYKFRRVVLF